MCCVAVDADAVAAAVVAGVDGVAGGVDGVGAVVAGGTENEPLSALG